MNKFIRSLILANAALILLTAHSSAQSVSVKQVKLTQFEMQSSAVIVSAGDMISSENYVSTAYWFPVTVPCTVLTGLVQNKIYADPYIGMNNMLIPDASDSFNHQWNLEQYSFLPNDPNPWKKPYWYRTVFSVPASDRNKNFQLIFKGINYRAEVWLNGKRFADSSQMAGMFAEYSLNVSEAIRPGGENVLAVKIFPLDYPGLPSHPQLKALGDFYQNGGPTGDIGKNVTMLSSIGWDWIPEVRDRNMGIWQPVYLRTSGKVVIGRAHLVTELPALPDTAIAKISLRFSLFNNSDQPQNGRLKISISPENFVGNPVEFGRPANLAAGEAKEISLSAAEAKELTIHRPRLWWPNGYGKPNLYRIRLQYLDAGGISDDTSFVFGIRTVGSATTTLNGWVRRDFYVNGRRVHLVGGAWVPDMMLNRDSVRYDYELHLCRNANVNLVRIWGGGIGETDDFYELADRYGLMVWQDFWITGDTHGEFKGTPAWPLEGDIFVRNIISTIYRIRNHPSLLVWTGGNEGHARQELYNAMRDNVASLDGSRPFIPSSSGFARQSKEWKGSWPDDQPAGVYSGGPYSWQDAAQYYRLVDRGRDWVFKDETGIPSQPPYNTLVKIIPNLVPDSSLPYPLNNTWGYHDACSGNGKYDIYYKAMVRSYGTPSGLKDFSLKMQMVNANGYRGIFEAVGHKLAQTGGVMLWKLNAAFPSVVWQVYDWYLEPNAGYYFMQRACEPLHIQLNLDDSSVAVVNRTYHDQRQLGYEVEVLTPEGSSLYKKTGKLDIDSVNVREVLSIAGILQKSDGLSFVILHLKDASGKPLSSNTYWMSAGNDYKDLSKMPAAKVNMKINGVKTSKAKAVWNLEIGNPSNRLAFFLNPQLIHNGEEVLPSFWSNNYFSLLPHETISVTVSCPIAMVGGAGSNGLRIEGQNIAGQFFSLPDLTPGKK